MLKSCGKKLSLILLLAESALELVSKDLLNHPAIVNHAYRLGKAPNEILLDRSYHHKAMTNLQDAEKRGRPDIVHMTLLGTLGTPLNKEGLLHAYVHTISDQIIEVSSKTRLPRNFNRFVSLFEQLFKLGKVPEIGEPLLSIKKEKLSTFIEKLRPSKIIAFSSVGRLNTLKNICSQIAKEAKPLIIIGGFPHGHFRDETINLADETVSIDKEALEAPVVTSRIIYEYEIAIGLDRKRIDLRT